MSNSHGIYLKGIVLVFLSMLLTGKGVHVVYCK